MQWIFVLCGCMFLLSLIATYQVCTVLLKAGLYTYKAVEPTAPMVALWPAGAVPGAAAHRGRSASHVSSRWVYPHRGGTSWREYTHKTARPLLLGTVAWGHHWYSCMAPRRITPCGPQSVWRWSATSPCGRWTDVGAAPAAMPPPMRSHARVRIWPPS